MIKLKYKYKIHEVTDNEGAESIDIHYYVRWYYGIFPWQSERKFHILTIPTCEHPEEGKINIFHELKGRDLPNHVIRDLVDANIRQVNADEGIDIIVAHRQTKLNKWSSIEIVEVEVDEKTGLTPQREESIELLKKEWYGNSN